MGKGRGIIIEMDLYRRVGKPPAIAPYERGEAAPAFLTRPRAANDEQPMTRLERLRASMPRLTIFN